MNTQLAQQLLDIGIDLDDLAEDDILTGAQAAREVGLSRAAITQWRERGYLGPNGEREHLRNIGTPERPRYLRADVARAEHATRERATRGLRNDDLIAGRQILDHRARRAARAA